MLPWEDSASSLNCAWWSCCLLFFLETTFRIPLGGYVRTQGPAGGATHVGQCSTLNIILRLHCNYTKPFTTAVLLSVKSSQIVILKGFGVWSVAFQVLSAESFRPLALHPHASSSSPAWYWSCCLLFFSTFLKEGSYQEITRTIFSVSTYLKTSGKE